MKTYDDTVMPSPALDQAGIRAYASYFGVWFVPSLLLARAVGYTVGASGAVHATLYSLAWLIASHRLLERFFAGQKRGVQTRECHRLAMHCATVTAIASVMLTWLAARIGLVSFDGEAQRAASAELLLLIGLPIVWGTDYVLFRLIFAEPVCKLLYERWRNRGR